MSLFLDGYDDALIGVLRQVGRPDVALYDADHVIQMIASQLADNGTDPEFVQAQAVDHFYYNIADTYAGPATPAFAHLGQEAIYQLAPESGQAGRPTDQDIANDSGPHPIDGGCSD